MPKTTRVSVPVTAPTFGAWLVEKREKDRRSQFTVAREICKVLDGTGLQPGKSLIQKIEKGRLPSWPLLLAISHVYRIPLQDLVLKLTTTLDFRGVEKVRNRVKGEQLVAQLDVIPNGVADAARAVPAEILFVALTTAAQTLNDTAELFTTLAGQLGELAGELWGRSTTPRGPAPGRPANPGTRSPTDALVPPRRRRA